jgi:hypothetical protein
MAKRKPSGRKINPRPWRGKPPVISLHVKRSAELWLDTFEQAVFVYLEGDALKRTDKAVEWAHDLADKVVDRFEARWPGVKL